MMPKSSEIEGLLSRLEAATGPDQELASDICEALGFQVRRGEHLTRFGRRHRSWAFLADGHWTSVRSIMSSVDAALALAEWMLPGTWYVMAKGQTRPEEPLFAHQILDVDEDRQLGIGEGATQPLAILIALLRALSARPRP